MRTKKTLTGKMRYRTTWTGRMVLQVECGDRTWRDAKVFDMADLSPYTSIRAAPHA